MTNATGKSASEGKVFGCFRLPLGNSSSSSSYNQNERQLHNTSRDIGSSNVHDNTISSSVFSVARSLIPTWRLLKLDPSNTLYFPYEPGKQVRSAIRIKNTSKSHVAFKFQTTAPKSCFMRPPGAILAPGESIITTVFRFFEHPESNQKPLEKKSKIKFMEKNSRIKFRIMSLKVQGVTDYVPELFDEHKHKVLVQQILRVVFLDIERPSHALEKLNRLLAEAAPAPAPEATKKPPVYVGPNTNSGEGLIVDEWKERRERYLAQQQSEGLDSV